MTSKETLNIIITYNYWRGAEDNIGDICVHPDYIKAKKYYNLALDKIEKDLEMLETLKLLIKEWLNEKYGKEEIRKEDEEWY